MAEGVEESETGAGFSAPEMSAAAALAVGAKGNARQDAELDAFLAKQGSLVDLQMEHLHEQRELILSRLRGNVITRTPSPSSSRLTKMHRIGPQPPGIGRGPDAVGPLCRGAGAFEAARGLDLNLPDRAALDVLLDRTSKGPLHG